MWYISITERACFMIIKFVCEKGKSLVHSLTPDPSEATAAMIPVTKKPPMKTPNTISFNLLHIFPSFPLIPFDRSLVPHPAFVAQGKFRHCKYRIGSVVLPFTLTSK